MLFFQSAQETALTSAVLSNDLEKLLQLKNNSLEQLLRNSLGFNGLELAVLLDKRECLNILCPAPPKNFKVKLKGESQFSIMSQEEFEKAFRFKYLKTLKFRTYEFLRQVIHSSGQIFFHKPKVSPVTPEILKTYQSTEEIFALRGEFYREKIYLGDLPALTIDWINEQMGYGLFADENLKKGDYVGCYAGEARKLAFWLSQNDHSIFYPNLSFFTYLVDGQSQGNEMRFINHSVTKANLDPHVAAHHGITHSIFLANRDIVKGEQLFWNYGEGFWSTREPPQEFF